MTDSRCGPRVHQSSSLEIVSTAVQWYTTAECRGGAADWRQYCHHCQRLHVLLIVRQCEAAAMAACATDCQTPDRISRMMTSEVELHRHRRQVVQLTWSRRRTVGRRRACHARHSAVRRHACLGHTTRSTVGSRSENCSVRPR